MGWPLSACRIFNWAFSFILLKVFLSEKFRTVAPRVQEKEFTPQPQEFLYGFKVEVSSVPQGLVSTCPHWKLLRPLLQVASSFLRMSPLIFLPNSSWKGSTANSQIATTKRAGRTEVVIRSQKFILHTKQGSCLCLEPQRLKCCYAAQG